MVTHCLLQQPDHSYPSTTAGVCNSAADMLSWNQRAEFLTVYCQASRTPAPMPSPLMCFLSLKCLTGHHQHSYNIHGYVDSNSAAVHGALIMPKQNHF